MLWDFPPKKKPDKPLRWVFPHDFRLLPTFNLQPCLWVSVILHDSTRNHIFKDNENLEISRNSFLQYAIIIN